MLIQLKSLIKACDRIKLSYTFFDDNQNCIIVHAKQGKIWFVNFAVSINTDADNNIAQDKYFTYKLLIDSVKQPNTTCYVDPFISDQYSEYIKERNYDAITDEIVKHHSLPCIVKQTRGTHGINVFICATRSDIQMAVSTILNQKSKDYDYTVLAQEYITPLDEFRLVVLYGKIQFVYKKDTSNATYNGNVSPLHWEDARAALIDDQALIKRCQSFVDSIYKIFPIAFTGIDLIVDAQDEIYLIEVNSRPGLGFFIRDNGDEKVVNVYEEILNK